MSDNDSQHRRRPWLAEASFWRDVTIRTISGVAAGLIITAVIYFSTIIFGYLARPENLFYVIGITSVVISVLGLAAGIIVNVGSHNNLKYPRTRFELGMLIGFAILFVFCTTVFIWKLVQ